ncbi:hypothetical protein [Rhodococcus pyridinivorans]|uniref:hypothetical protein n=1 Tax=Rhodococcus pyridinivorans TaxID=103816 RepID=UPI0026594655|nr:hypothetical protein [Rhodococcus pyridinivorans]
MVLRTAMELTINDVIIAPDGSRHTVKEIDRPETERAWLTIHTDTKLAISKDKATAGSDTYYVITADGPGL